MGGKSSYPTTDTAVANADRRLFLAFVASMLIAGVCALVSDTPLWLALPLAALGLAVLAVDWRWVYYVLLFTLAFSMEIPLPGGLSMDVPSEPLMLVLLACFGVNMLLGRSTVESRFWVHPLVIIMGQALIWAAVITLFSVDTTKSIKYLLAKTWYIVPFVFVTLAIVRRPADVWRVAACHVAGACLTFLYTFARHAGHGFSFDGINPALLPFYKNHVAYAATLSMLIPYALYASRQPDLGLIWRWLWRAAFGMLLLGVLLSYTRASMASLPLAVGFYFVIRWRLTRLALAAAALAAAASAFYFVSQNNYMLYAPDYEKTVFYGDNFGKHLEATYNLEDLSGMERVYRWVAAARMISDRPITGSGPNTFYPEYKRYTVSSFRTYVSRNPEQSTTHNYFLLMLAEQGIPGFLLFAILVATALIMVERLYHRSHSAENRRVVLAAGLSLFIIITHLLLNELVEVDKVGSFFYIALALLMRAEGWIKDERVALTK
ncbi:O-antigen polymerase [Hymenobacter roseosalivarius DSM 11622]|uniref:O-antigen polymerase n=1 Tax=Hymenobacter roseosalivarius DSM 11622 TaxID=645990 RepID=A0A1W1VJG9_9BACT|nr:O-antigen ligase family protein [Hymenobacter roseosalivarius]SMB93201.1 O-antigen polymerase [Hymenobacter roseosalivarius DSM 11622]